MDNLVKRNDPIYTDIEKFATYELTQCVAYEMAIRNGENLQRIDYVIEYYKNHYSLIYQDEKLGLTKEFQHIYKVIDTIDFINLHQDAHQYMPWKMYGHKFFDIVDDIKGHQFLYEGTIEFNELDKVTNPSLYFETLESLEERDGYSLYSSVFISDTDEKTNKQTVHTKGIRILENFKRPKIKVDEYESKRLSLEIDVNRPMEEIKSLIEHIKLDLGKKCVSIVSATELLDDTYYPFNFDSDERNTYMKENQKLANMFYIYDSMKLHVDKSEIIDNIMNYNIEESENVKDVKAMDSKTFDKHYKTACEYIDGCKYKELMTGLIIKS